VVGIELCSISTFFLWGKQQSVDDVAVKVLRASCEFSNLEIDIIGRLKVSRSWTPSEGAWLIKGVWYSNSVFHCHILCLFSSRVDLFNANKVQWNRHTD
jgi:hypothetical protein